MACGGRVADAGVERKPGLQVFRVRIDLHDLLQLHRQGVITMEEAKRLSRSTDLERKLITGEE